MYEPPDVLEQGGPERPRRRWPYAVATVVAAALLATGIAVAVRPGREPSAGGSAGPSVSSPATRPSAASSPQAVAAGRCGPVAVPSWSPTYPAGPTHDARVLAGGPDLTAVDLVTGRRRTVPVVAAAHLPGGFVQDVAVHDGTAYVLVGTCAEERAVVLAVRGRRVERLFADRVSALVDGPAGVWAAVTPRNTDKTLLRGVVGRTITLPPGVDVGARVTADGIVASRQYAESFRLLLLDPRNGRVVRRLGSAVALAAARHRVVWFAPDSCTSLGPADVACRVGRTDTRTGRSRSYVVPDRGIVTGGPAALDRTGRYAAFPVSTSEDLQIVQRIQVLDLRSGRWYPVPGLRWFESRTPTNVGVTYLRSGELVVSLAEGDHGHLALWRPGRPGTWRVPGRVPGPIDRYAPVVEAP